MNKALIEKAREYCKNTYGENLNSPEVITNTFIAGATWQREQLEAEILNKEKSWYAEFPDEKSAQEVFNIIKELQAENKNIREQLIKELREWIESNKELRGYTGIPDDTLNIILAKLDLLEKGGAK